MISQYTIAIPTQVQGVGIHSGVSVTLTIQPAPETHGLVFERVDLPGHPKVPVSIESLSHTDRATLLEFDGIRIRTPEHILSALSGLGVTNALLSVNAEEVPILDGSSLPFVTAIIEAGIEQQSGSINPIKVMERISLSDGDKSITIDPADHFSITYSLDYPDSFVGAQSVTEDISPVTYKKRIAPARTFGFKHEVEALLASGLALGGSMDNALVIGESDYLSPLRLPDECARHKILDIIGDLAVCGRPILGRIRAAKSGHAMNAQLARELDRLS
ncbi:UDP-3-O-[3-hydroxymyristoyl] N-acetylglucosamine deacetylase [bacterium]|jgi:UDP-3-O-[3-hydroxymyristoyl] N-acetylglucosamine deacetylase|nr:UDP-3-O-[3-hydroxymyristoyl] N-acetylglucosamine deacetylase [bacterium]